MISDINVEEAELVKCLYSHKMIQKTDAIKFGGFTDCGGHVFYFSKDFLPIHKLSRKLFDLYERNCNTCIHLERIKHPKCPYGRLYGKCKSTPIDYPHSLEDNNRIAFYPEDPMHMKCYEPRHAYTSEDDTLLASFFKNTFNSSNIRENT